MQGSKWDETYTKGKTNLLYVNLPVVARYQTKSGFFGEAGLQPGLLLSAKDKYEGSTDNYIDHMKRLDLGIPVGIGYEFKNKIGVGLRLIPGIRDISKDAYEKDRNLIIALRGTYKFKLK
ncbi:MAG: porin family protein [Bacteroidia bacterium]|nr:porin family protein [Bacteroidia bacterium]